MGHVDLEDFKEVLETMLAGLERRLLRRDGIAIEHTPDALDEVQYAAEREFAIRQLEQDSVRFRDVNAALRRIEEGVFGACLHCGSGQHQTPECRAVDPMLHRLSRCLRPDDGRSGAGRAPVDSTRTRGNASGPVRQSRLVGATSVPYANRAARGPKILYRCLAVASQTAGVKYRVGK